MTFCLFLFLEVNTPDAYVSSALFIHYSGLNLQIVIVILQAMSSKFLKLYEENNFGGRLKITSCE